MLIELLKVGKNLPNAIFKERFGIELDEDLPKNNGFDNV